MSDDPKRHRGAAPSRLARQLSQSAARIKRHRPGFAARCARDDPPECFRPD